VGPKARVGPEARVSGSGRADPRGGGIDFAGGESGTTLASLSLHVPPPSRRLQELEEVVEEVAGVVGAGRRLRMVLDREDGA